MLPLVLRPDSAPALALPRMVPQHPTPPRFPRLRPPSRALRLPPWLLLWPMAATLTGCANPDELRPGALASEAKAPPWQAAVAAAADASRRLTDGEGETVVANAVAAHEKRRP